MNSWFYKKCGFVCVSAHLINCPPARAMLKKRGGKKQREKDAERGEGGADADEMAADDELLSQVELIRIVLVQYLDFKIVAKIYV